MQAKSDERTKRGDGNGASMQRCGFPARDDDYDNAGDNADADA